MESLDKAWQEIRDWSKGDRLKTSVRYRVPRTGETGYTNSKSYLDRPGVEIVDEIGDGVKSAVSI